MFLHSFNSSHSVQKTGNGFTKRTGKLIRKEISVRVLVWIITLLAHQF